MMNKMFREFKIKFFIFAAVLFCLSPLGANEGGAIGTYKKFVRITLKINKNFEYFVVPVPTLKKVVLDCINYPKDFLEKMYEYDSSIIRAIKVEKKTKKRILLTMNISLDQFKVSHKVEGGLLILDIGQSSKEARVNNALSEDYSHPKYYIYPYTENFVRVELPKIYLRPLLVKKKGYKLYNKIVKTWNSGLIERAYKLSETFLRKQKKSFFYDEVVAWNAELYFLMLENRGKPMNSNSKQNFWDCTKRKPPYNWLARCHYFLGQYYLNTREFDRALMEFEKGAEISEQTPFEPYFISSRAQVFYLTGKTKKAMDILEQVASEYPKFKVSAELKKMLAVFNKKDFKSASRYLKKNKDSFEVVAGKNPWLYFIFGELSLANDNYLDALKFYTQANKKIDKKSPIYSMALYRLGQINRLKGSMPAAKRYLVNAQKYINTDGDIMARIAQREIESPEKMNFVYSRVLKMDLSKYSFIVTSAKLIHSLISQQQLELAYRTYLNLENKYPKSKLLDLFKPVLEKLTDSIIRLTIAVGSSADVTNLFMAAKEKALNHPNRTNILLHVLPHLVRTGMHSTAIKLTQDEIKKTKDDKIYAKLIAHLSAAYAESGDLFRAKLARDFFNENYGRYRKNTVMDFVEAKIAYFDEDWVGGNRYFVKSWDAYQNNANLFYEYLMDDDLLGLGLFVARFARDRKSYDTYYNSLIERDISRKKNITYKTDKLEMLTVAGSCKEVVNASKEIEPSEIKLDTLKYRVAKCYLKEKKPEKRKPALKWLKPLLKLKKSPLEIVAKRTFKEYFPSDYEELLKSKTKKKKKKKRKKKKEAA